MAHNQVNGSQPGFVCAYCGETYGRHLPGVGASWHNGDCGVCQEEQVPVTQTRDFGGLVDGWQDEADGRELA